MNKVDKLIGEVRIKECENPVIAHLNKIGFSIIDAKKHLVILMYPQFHPRKDYIFHYYLNGIKHNMTNGNDALAIIPKDFTDDEIIEFIDKFMEKF